MRKGHLLEGCVGPDSLSHFDSKCWVLLNSFLVDMISVVLLCSVSLQATPPSLLPSIHPSLRFSSWMNNSLQRVAFIPHSLYHSGSLYSNTRGNFPPAFLSFCVSVCVSFFSVHCESSTVLSHASFFSPFTPSSPLLPTCSLTGSSETVQI